MEPADDEHVYEPRTAEQVRYDAMSDQVRDAAASVTELAKVVRELAANPGNTNTVIHRTEGAGIGMIIGMVICATVSVMCVVLLIIGAIFIVPDIHDLQAWQGTFGRDLAAIKAVQHKEGQK